VDLPVTKNSAIGIRALKATAGGALSLLLLVGTLAIFTSPAAAGAADGIWPTAATTGVPAGTRLTSRSGNITITEDGTVIDSINLTGCVNVVASNVTIRRSRITCSGSNAAVWQFSGRSGLLVEDTEIIGATSNPAGAGIWAADAYTARRVEIRGTDDGAFATSGTVIRDS